MSVCSSQQLSLQIELFSQSWIQYLLDNSIFTKALCSTRDRGDSAAVRILSKDSLHETFKGDGGEEEGGRGRVRISSGAMRHWCDERWSPASSAFEICVCKVFCVGFT